MRKGNGSCENLTQSKRIQAALAVNRLGPCATSILRACCSTYTTTSHFLSLKAQKCDPTCPSPAAGRSGTHSGPGNTTRQICTIHRGGHVPKAPPVRVLSGCTLRSCVRARSAPLTRPAAPHTTVERRHPALEGFGQEEQLVHAGPCGSSLTVPTVPLARLHRHRQETFTVSAQHSWPMPTAADRRAQRGEAAANSRKMGVGSHCHAHFPEQPKRFLPTN